MEQMFFSDWSSLLRTLVIGTLAYITLVLFLRISGKRTLSKLNAFDLIVTVSLGSTLATVLLNRDVSFANGALAFSVLIALQFVVTWSSVRVRWVRVFVTGKPSMLLYRGELLESALRTTRVTRHEVYAAIRKSGHLHLRELEAVVLETDGSLTVMKRGDGDDAIVLSDDVVRVER